MNDIKLVVTDLDGTFLRSDHTFSPKLDDIISKLQAQGTKFIICTGRQLHNVVRLFEGHNGLDFICNNGAHSIVDGEETFITLPKEAYRKAIAQIKQNPGHYILAESRRGLLIEKGGPKELFDALKGYCVNVQEVDNLLEIEDDICKITLLCFDGAEDALTEKYDNLKQYLNIQPSGGEWLDMMPIGVNKGTMIAKVQEKYGIKPSETIVFGDHLNDIEMIVNCPNSYAMKNGHDVLKKYAKNITPYTNNEDGVIHIIEEVVLK